MKLTILLLLAAVPALSQSSNLSLRENPQTVPFAQLVLPVPAPDSACEVNIVKAAFDRPTKFMLVAAGARSTAPPSLRFELKNLSAKRVRSVDLLARIKVKDSIYQLDSTTREFSMHIASSEGAQRLQLVDTAVGFDSLAIEQVIYADGTGWRPQHRLACAFRAAGVAQLLTSK